MSQIGNTLRLSGEALGALHDAYDAATDLPGRRTHQRWPFRQTVLVRLNTPGARPLALAGHDFSGGGVSLMHNAYMHPGTPCTVMMPMLGGQYAAMEGKVARCAHFRGTVHVLGVQFDKPINVRDFLTLDPHRGQFMMGAVEPGKLTGRLLHVEDGEMDRKLVQHFVRETKLKVVSVPGAKAAIDALGAPGDAFVAVVIDFDLPDGNGADLARQLHGRGMHCPVILVSAHPLSQVHDVAKQAGVSAVISKPFTEETLLSALGEFLLNKSFAPQSSSGPITSTLPADAPEQRFVPEFVQSLRDLGTQLFKALAAADAAGAQRLCLKFKGTAPALGFPGIADACGAALRALADSPDIEASRSSIQVVIGMCQRASAIKPD